MATRSRIRHALVMMVWIAGAVVHAGCPRPASIEHRVIALTDVETTSSQLVDDIARSAGISAIYDVLFAEIADPASLASLDDGDVVLAHKAAYKAAFYTHHPRHVRHMMLATAELKARRLGAGYEKPLYEMLVGARMLAEARALAAAHPELALARLPAIRTAAGLVAGRPSEWVIVDDGRELLHRNREIARPAQILVVTHPRCGFSVRAMRAIASDPVLRGMFSNTAAWLAPQSGNLDLEEIQQWNRAHPAQVITIAYLRDEWPMIHSWGTPTFYFLYDGIVRARVTGWPQEGRRHELIAAARQIGLVTPSSAAD